MLGHGLKVVRHHAAEEVAPEKVGPIVPHDEAGRAIGRRVEAARIHREDGVGGALDQVAVARLGAEHRVARLAFLGDVAERRDHARDLAQILERRRAHLHRTTLAVGAHDHRLVSLPHPLECRALAPGDVIAQLREHDIVHRDPADRLGRVAEERERRGIGEGNAAQRIGDDDRIARRLDHAPMALGERMERRDVVERHDRAAVRMRRRHDVEDEPARRRPHRAATHLGVDERVGDRRVVRRGGEAQHRLVKGTAAERLRIGGVRERERAAVAAPDAPVGIEHHHADGDGVEGHLPLVPRALHLLEELRVHDRDRHLIGQSLEHEQVGVAVRRLAVEHGERADRAAGGDHRRDHRPGDLGDRGNGTVKARVAVHIVRDDGRALPHGRAVEAPLVWHAAPEERLSRADGRHHLEVVAALEHHARAIASEERDRVAEREIEHLVQPQRPVHRASDLGQRLGLRPLAQELAQELRLLGRETREQRLERREVAHPVGRERPRSRHAGRQEGVVARRLTSGARAAWRRAGPRAP